MSTGSIWYDADVLSGAAIHRGRRVGTANAPEEYALKLDPASLFPNHAAAWIYLLQGQFDKAEVQARRTVDLFPDAVHAYFVLGWTAWHQRRHGEAVAIFERAVSLSREATSLAFLGYVYGQLGRRDW